MTVHLVVVRAFGPYARGDVISDAMQMATVLVGEHADSVVRVTVLEG
jgi:hypothetical protein